MKSKNELTDIAVIALASLIVKTFPIDNNRRNKDVYNAFRFNLSKVPDTKHPEWSKSIVDNPYEYLAEHVFSQGNTIVLPPHAPYQITIRKNADRLLLSVKRDGRMMFNGSTTVDVIKQLQAA